MEIGAQFYTVRELCKNINGFADTLKRVADIGYKTVQISGTCEFDPEWLKAELNKNGLKCVLTHTPADKLKADPAGVARDHDIFGCKYVGLGWFGFNDSDKKTCDDFTAEYGPVIKELKKNGRYFMYHNHDQEFKKENGKLIIERLA